MQKNIEKYIEKEGLRLLCKVKVFEHYNRANEKKETVKNNIQVTVVDIDVSDSIQIADFSYVIMDNLSEFVEERTKNDKLSIQIQLKNCKKQFPNIKKLVFSNDFETINLLNRSFPNVRAVTVKKVNNKESKFLSGNILVTSEGKLLNTFCLTEQESLNLKNVKCIENGAFNGCAAVKIKGFKHLYLTKESLNGYVLTEKSPFIIQPDENNVIQLTPYTQYIVNDIIDEYTKECTIIATCVNHMKVLNEFLYLLANAWLWGDYSCKLKVQLDIAKNIPLKYILEIFDRANSTIDNLEISEKNQFYKIYDNMLFSKDGKILYRCDAHKSGMVIIPDGVKFIFSDAFNNCKKVTEIKIPDSVSNIGNKAFAHMERLKTIHLGNGLERIDGVEVFFQDISLTEVEIPKNIKFIGESMFRDCISLKNVIFHHGIEVISRLAFKGCKNLFKINLPSTLKFIGDDAFANTSFINIDTSDSCPVGLMNAVLTVGYDHDVYNNITGKTIVDLKTGKKIYLPHKIMSYDDKLLLSDLWDNGVLEYEEPLFILDYCQESCFVLLKLHYDNPKNKKIKNMLKSKENVFVDIFLKEAKKSNHDDCIAILNAGFLSYKNLKRLLDGVTVTDDATLSAYILNAMNAYCKDVTLNL